MKKITLLLIMLASVTVWSQELNQAANWPNANWAITGSHVTDSNVFTENPTTSSSSFSFDDDNAGGSSVNNIAAESPIIDLTDTYNAGETYIYVASSYVLNIYENETLIIQYWDDDSSSWVNWGMVFSDNTGAQTDFCNATFDSFDSAPLDISSFTASQLSGFKYRISYDDNGSYGWGFCFSSPTIYSTIPPTCPVISNPIVSAITGDSATVTWTPGSSEMQWEVSIAPSGSGTPGSGDVVSSASQDFSGLNSNASYEIYIKALCGGGDESDWFGPTFFQTENNSPATFSNVSISTSGTNRAVVDMNGDFLDDIVSISSTNINIQLQQEAGGFNEMNVTTTSADFTPSWSLAAADYNADGYTDLLYGGGSGVTFMRSNGDMTYTEFSGPDYVFSQRSNFVDINNDGHLDAFVCHDVQPNVYYINDGSGNLTYYQTFDSGAPYVLGDDGAGGNYGSVWIDYDNDRDQDMFIAKCRGGNPTISIDEMYTNNGDGTFTENASTLNLADSMQTWSSAWGDYDNDGDMDVFVGASSGTHKLMRNDGGMFTDVTGASGVTSLTDVGIENATHDFDNDGNLDIASNGNILFGNGDMTFTVVNNILNGSNGSFGDLNNDGFIDAFRGSIYMNDGGSNNWVKINTIGTNSNINGIGARIEVYTPNTSQIRDVRSGEGFRYMSSLNTHFGLGTETIIETLVVYWPSGTVDVLSNQAVNTTITITEGQSLSVEDPTLVDLVVYPNPVKNVLSIKTSGDLINKIATVFNLEGKKVLNSKLTSDNLDVSSLSSGMYMLRIESQGKTTIRKFIKE